MSHIPALVLILASLVTAWPADAAADPPSTELRFRIFTTSYRWSSFRSGVTSTPSTGARSLYLVPAIGLRFYPKNGHGALVDVDYRIDVDVDGPFICIFSCPDYLVAEFVVAHAGYAYRYVIASPHKFGRLAWAFTPHASLSAGASFTQRTVSSVYGTIREQSPVVGGRVGLDIDLHIKRFFMGWTLRYEVLAHTKGSLSTSHFLTWNIIPALAIGAVLGPPVRPSPRD